MAPSFLFSLMFGFHILILLMYQPSTAITERYYHIPKHGRLFIRVLQESLSRTTVMQMLLPVLLLVLLPGARIA
jgi:hypothetical protein